MVVSPALEGACSGPNSFIFPAGHWWKTEEPEQGGREADFNGEPVEPRAGSVVSQFPDRRASQRRQRRLAGEQRNLEKAGSERKERNPPWRMKPELGDRVGEESVTVLNLKLLFYTNNV